MTTQFELFKELLKRQADERMAFILTTKEFLPPSLSGLVTYSVNANEINPDKESDIQHQETQIFGTDSDETECTLHGERTFVAFKLLTDSPFFDQICLAMQVIQSGAMNMMSAPDQESEQ